MRSMPFDHRIDILTHRCSVGFQDEIRILYVVDGSCAVILSGHRSELEKSDLILANAGELLSFEPFQDTMAVSICFNKYALCDLLETASVTFFANSAEDTGQKYTELKAHIQNLLMAYVSEGKANEIMEQGHCFLLVQVLLTKFSEQSQNRIESEDDSQIAKIIHYIHANYKSNMSLNEIAERLFISPSWASRVFQKETGDNFTTYVKKVRLEHVKQALEQSNHPITQIAVDNGLSTPSALNRIFKSEYGITPTEYRERNKSVTVNNDQDDTRNTERLQRILASDQKMSIADLENQISLHVDAAQLIPWRKWENRILNVGPADCLSSANLQKQVLFLASTLDVEYLRIWNVFSSKLMILGSNKGDYNFTFIDEILDFCVDNRLKLFIDLAQRKEVALASEKQEIYSYESAAIFENASVWLDALRSFLVHIRRRYHGNTVGSWIFELTFFLNDRPYYAAETYSSISVWEQSYELVKEIIPNARIAGPGLIASPDQESMGEVIKYFLSSRHHPDIFTTMHFPYSPENTLGAVSIYQKQYKKVTSRTFLDDEALYIQKMLNENSFQGEYWITDWGNSLANRNYVQDSCFRAAFIVENVLRTQEHVGAMGIFYASDLINLFSDSNTVLSGSAGLLSRHGICKPAYYAYRFLSRLGKYRITQTENCIVTAEHTGDIRILCFNNMALGPKYYLAEENTYRPNELSSLFVNSDPLCMELILTYPDDEEIIVVRQKILNTGKGSVLDKWIGFDCAVNLTRSDMEYLEKTSMPEIIAERMVPVNRTLQISFKMEPNEIRLITITRE